MIKTIYILWFQGFKNAPDIVQQCIKSWYYYNPDWNIILIDNNNLIDYINLEEYDLDFSDPNILNSHKSDIIRIILLKKYGGLWCDATVFCNRPLNSWLENYIKEGFFGFSKPSSNRLISSWFLYGDKDNYIVDKWCLNTLKHFKNKYNPNVYYWFHYLFGVLYNTDNNFKEIWNKVPIISANLPHILQFGYGLFKPITNQIKKEINDKMIPLYKLTYKTEFPLYDENLNLYYLYNTIK